MRTSEQHTLTLRLKASELLDDIRQEAFLEGKVMSGDNEPARHETIDIAEDGNIDLVARNLSLAFSECVEMLFPFTKETVAAEEERTDSLKTPDVFEMKLSVPASFSKTTCTLLAGYVHEYVKCRAMHGFFAVTKSAACAALERRMETARVGILKCKSTRAGRTRRKTTPF